MVEFRYHGERYTLLIVDIIDWNDLEKWNCHLISISREKVDLSSKSTSTGDPTVINLKWHSRKVHVPAGKDVGLGLKDRNSTQESELKRKKDNWSAQESKGLFQVLEPGTQKIIGIFKHSFFLLKWRRICEHTLILAWKNNVLTITHWTENAALTSINIKDAFHQDYFHSILFKLLYRSCECSRYL